MVRVFRRILLVLAPLDAAFLLATAFGLSVPVLARWAMGALIAAAAIVEGGLWCQQFAQERRFGTPARRAAAKATRTIVGEPLWRLARFELASMRSLLRWFVRRPRLPQGARSLSYHRQLSAVLWVLVSISVLELVVLHLLLPWPTARLVAAAIGVYGLVWVLGYRAAMIINPHALTDACLHIRYGATIDMPIPLATIDAVAVRRRDCFGSKRAVQFIDASPPNGATLQLAILNQTNIDIALSEPLVEHDLAEQRPVHGFRLFADDPESFVRTVVAEQARRRGRGGGGV